MRKVILVFAFANVLLGARAQNDSTRTLKEVVVTATKFPKSLSETGKVLTVIDEDQIKRSVGKDISQLLNDQAGIVVNGANSNSGKDKSIYLRGAASKYTLVLLDGVPVNDPTSIDGGAFDLRLLPLDQIERIEILKGSQSTLYGSDAIAGVINIITKKGGEKKLSASGLASYGSYNTSKVNATVAGSTKAVDYNIGFAHYSTEGISEAKDATGNGNFDKDGVTQNSFQANLGFSPTKQLTVRPFFRYNYFFNKFDYGAYQDDPTNFSRLHLINTGLSAQYKLKTGSIHGLYGYDDTERNYTSGFGTYVYKGRFHNADVFMERSLSKNIQLLVGVNYQSWKMLDTTATEKNPSITISSPYASFFIKNLNGFSAELGGRYNSHSKYGNNFTWSFNPSYWLLNQVKIFFNYSTGFKAPVLSQLYGQYGANPNLKPEKSESIEGGIHFVTADRKFDVRGVAFARNIKDVIIYNSSYQYVNFNEQNDYGFEIEPSLNLSDKISFKAFYAFVDGKVKTKNANGQDTTYNNLIRRPKNSFGLSFNLQLTDRFFFSASLKTFGKRNDQYYDNNFLLQNVALNSYQLVNMYWEYRVVKQVKVFFEVKNLLNQDYMEIAGYNALKSNFTTGVSARL